LQRTSFVLVEVGCETIAKLESAEEALDVVTPKRPDL